MQGRSCIAPKQIPKAKVPVNRDSWACTCIAHSQRTTVPPEPPQLPPPPPAAWPHATARIQAPCRFACARDWTPGPPL
eukprot:4780716-Alexandrium_andersonii.AAC.1